jgi:hypothetical protein
MSSSGAPIYDVANSLQLARGGSYFTFYIVYIEEYLNILPNDQSPVAWNTEEHVRDFERVRPGKTKSNFLINLLPSNSGKFRHEYKILLKHLRADR